MDYGSLNRLLRDEARDYGLCDQWYDGWELDCTREELICKYLRGIDFCILHDYPSLDFIRENFPLYQLHANGIYLDDSMDVDCSGMLVSLGSSNLRITISGYVSCPLYLRHDSVVDVKVSGGARVFIECYDRVRLSIDCGIDSKVFVYRYGGSVSFVGNVLIREKSNG